MRAAAVSSVSAVTTACTGPSMALNSGAISAAPPKPVMPRMKPASVTTPTIKRCCISMRRVRW
jgi:hypothetical protein